MKTEDAGTTMLLDASAVSDLFMPSINSIRIKRHLAGRATLPMISDFAVGEFASAVMRRVRIGQLDQSAARRIFDAFDAWRAAATEAVATEPSDIRLAAVHLRRFDLVVRMPDAIHIATAQRLGVPLCSFDTGQLAAARRLGVDVAAMD
jgi:uncharacterized protein